jgi:RND family efflux transporter MFP subunit
MMIQVGGMRRAWQGAGVRALLGAAVVGGAVALALSGAVRSGGVRAADAAAGPSTAGVPAGLKTARVEFTPVDGALGVEGVVEAVRQSVVSAQVPGRILEVRVEAGKMVARGEVLARIDDREAAQIVAAGQAQIARAEADFANARVSFDRSRRLTEQKFLSPAALDRAQADLDAARAQLESVKATAEQSVAARGHATITAPFAGVVSIRHVQQGDMAQPGMPLFTLHDPSRLRVVASVPQAQLRDVRAAGLAQIELTALGQTVKAAGVQFMPSADLRSHTTPVWLDLPAGLRDVLPGMYARALFAVGQARKLVIPAAAVTYRSEVAGAYVVDDKGELRFRQLRLGEAAGAGGIEVLAGVVAGERVAIDPVAALAQMKAAQPRAAGR